MVEEGLGLDRIGKGQHEVVLTRQVVDSACAGGDPHANDGSCVVELRPGLDFGFAHDSGVAIDDAVSTGASPVTSAPHNEKTGHQAGSKNSPPPFRQKHVSHINTVPAMPGLLEIELLQLSAPFH